MNESFFADLGLCRKAGSLCMGHDDVKLSLRKGEVHLIIFASDASERLKEEISGLANGTETVQTEYTMNEIGARIGRRAGVLAVKDKGLAFLVSSAITKED